MRINSDCSDLLRLFADEKVECLLVGAHAVAFHAEPRFTKDVDLWVRPSAENAVRVHRALVRFGAPLEDVGPEVFTETESVYQIGVAPNRIDVVMSVDGVSFDEAWPDRIEARYGETPVDVIGKDALIRTKRASGRPQDLLDLERLL